jgi:alpha/beta superfamily hydrolase
VGLTEGRPASFATPDGLTLEGLLHLPDVTPCPASWSHPHPQYGGEMRNTAGARRAAIGVGAAALRFNFRGVGASEGSFDNGIGEQKDVEGALEHMRGLPEIDASRIAVAGYSFGSMVVLRYAHLRDDLAAVVLVSNPTKRGPRLELSMRVPTLFVTGDRDEYCDGALLMEYRDQIGDDVTVVVHDGVDHFWWGSDDRLMETVSGFLRDHLVQM